LESFTVTTKDIEFFDQLESLSECTSQASAIFPVFPQQPQDVRVLWGFALFPENEGDHVKKNMLFCSGAYVMSEILYHLDLPREMASKSYSVLLPSHGQCHE
jgi:oleate hydratase